MSAGRIGRVFVASLHQAIEEELPTRLEFYEHWLNPEGLRGGTIGLAPMKAVLSFLRQEGEVYERVVARAGRLAATWDADRLSSSRRSLVEALPAWLRVRAVARMARRLIRETDSETSGRSSFRRGEWRMVVRGSLFCDLREPGTLRLCGFYAAAIGTLLDRFQIPGVARVVGCRAAEDAECLILIEPPSSHASQDE